MKAVNMRVVLILLASLGAAGCARDQALEASVEAAALEVKDSTAQDSTAQDLPAQKSQSGDSPAPEPGDLLAKARAIAASKGLGGGEDEARARAALAPIASGGALATTGAASDAQAIFQRAAMRFAAQGGGDKTSGERSDKTSRVTSAEQLDANDPREIFRKAQTLVRERALADARAFGALAPAQAPATNPQTYFVEAMRLRQQQSALALGALAQ